jgi:hypothetical protein
MFATLEGYDAEMDTHTACETIGEYKKKYQTKIV